MTDLRRRIANNAACQQHITLVARDDPLFYISHRHYLAKGLTSGQRAVSALSHYDHETTTFDEAYFDAVYRQGALLLWQQAFEGHVFDMRLMPGNDVLYEGGASIVLHMDGGRLAVMSYSAVPSPLLVPGDRAGAVLFVTRKQLTHDHDYQKVFNKAFDRSTPGHLCFGALTGIALAQGMDRMVGIVAASHPSCSAPLEARMKVAYDDFWASLEARPGSPFGVVIDLPMRLTPLDDLDAKARKRAIARREHIRHVQESAQATIARHLRQPQG
jgi:uncharacterized protein VirK/YbjX